MRISDAPRTPVETGRLTIDLAALAANWRFLAARCGAGACGAVVKADGYGIGLEPAMRTLLAAGCRSFFVANAAEGRRARALSREAVIYVFDGLVPGAAAELIDADLRPALGSLAEIAEWATAGQGRPCALHFDTGMNRMGLAVADGAQAREMTAGLDVALVMSHFLCSQWRDDPRNGAQIAAFDVARAAFPGVAASLANSSGLFLPQAAQYQLARPGYALYGGNPTPDAANPMQRVVTLEARIVAVRHVAAGASVGYDAGWTAARPSRIATLGVGYADGIPVGASATPEKPGGVAIMKGVRCPFVGRVSMDFVTLDVTDVPGAQRGDWAEILGENISVDDCAARAGTIGYEILTRLGARYCRRYVGE